MTNLSSPPPPSTFKLYNYTHHERQNMRVVLFYKITMAYKL